MKIQLSILTFFLLCFSTLKAQQPSHFILGEEELAGINIYSLLQDKTGIYWIATNNGLYKYNGYSIDKIKMTQVISSSIFNLKEDYNHNIYCHNLSGQIFKIKNDSCLLYFNIPDSLLSHEISYNFDNQNVLTIATSKLFQVNSNHEINILYPNQISTSSQLFALKDSSLILYCLNNKSLLTIKNSDIRSKFIDIGDRYPNYLYFKNNLICYDKKSATIISELSDENPIFPTFKEQNSLSNYYSDNTNYWVGNLSGGIFLFDKDPIQTENEKPIFENIIISSFLKDNEGNILLGTFGDGIFVIPTLDIIDIKPISEKSKITKLVVGSNNQLYYGTQKGEIIEIDPKNHHRIIKKEGIQQIEILEYVPGLNSILTNDQAGKLINVDSKKSKEVINGSVKDLYRLDNINYLIATNSGLYISDFKTTPKPIKSFYGRSYCVGYNSNTQKIYCGTPLGLKIGDFDKAHIFKINGETVLCKDIFSHDNTIYVATKKRGVLVFNNDSLVDNWNTFTGLSSNHIKQIQLFRNQFIISTDKGINIIDQTGKLIHLINKSNGLNSNNIIDFEIINSILWVVTVKGIQKIDLDKFKPTTFTPIIQIQNIEVNDKIIDSTVHLFEYDENKFEFEISAKSLKYQNDICYQYQLVGIDDNWITSPYENNTIIYKSLPPGKYQLKVKAFYRLNESQTISYQFKVDRPFWRKWWFYMIIALSFLFIIIVSFQVQIIRQRHKFKLQNQLDSTQLTALKSQMNPHFIFNSLNSIQDLILQQDKEKAYNYISKFALLVRKILHHSDKDFIEIEEEIKILSVYLELEKLRFKRDFTFKLEANNITDLEIPPMLIQPFIENALKHGLLHKKGEKILSVTFTFTNSVLICTIIDNGIGRQKSNEIKQRQNKVHKSFSTQSIHTRFEILKNIYGENIGIEYVDLFLDGLAAGTKVILKIPYNRKF